MARFSFGIIVAFVAVSNSVSMSHDTQTTRLSRHQQRRNLQDATSAPSQTPPAPTALPTVEDFPAPSLAPTASLPPTITAAPTDDTTESPTSESTETPTSNSTENPTSDSSEAPTSDNSVAPTSANSVAPTSDNTQNPATSMAPTLAPVPNSLASKAPTLPRSEGTEALKELCTSTGGEVAQSKCCSSATPFPSQILIGACGCSPQNSEDTDVCQCPDGLSFDTTWGCVDRTAYLDCQRAGGMVYNDYCCESAEDFPNTCMMGACGCSPDDSVPILKCQCPDDKCWNGERCE